jgi:Transglutaminase-like superfamily
MRRIARFFALKPSDRALVLSTLAPLLAMRTAMWTLTFARVNRIADAMSRSVRAEAAGGQPSPERIAWAVANVSRVVPRGRNCLIRALATGIMLKRYGYPSELKIGVMKPPGGRLEAHAWLESGGSVVIGDFQLDQYVPLTAPDSVAR